MKLHDPARPRFGALPALLWEGKPVCAVPHVLVYPALGDTGLIGLHVNVLYKPVTARQYHWTIPENHLLIWWVDWMNDPEAILITAGWRYEAAASSPAKKFVDVKALAAALGI